MNTVCKSTKENHTEVESGLETQERCNENRSRNFQYL